jgi:hypothetical protein
MKQKQFLAEANRLVGYPDDGYNYEERIRRSLVRAYKRGVKAGLAQKERHVSHED